MLQMEGEVVKVEPYRACEAIVNQPELQGRIGVVERGDCMFIDKVCVHCTYSPVSAHWLGSLIMVVWLDGQYDPF